MLTSKSRFKTITMKKCFVIMPFSKTVANRDVAYWDSFFSEFLIPALKVHGFEAFKSTGAPQNITKQIVKDLAWSDLVLAVLTDGKPNVLWELGVRHTLRQSTIMILQKGHPRPFDISGYGILDYERDKLDDFKTQLGNFIQAIRNGDEGSPVADYLDQRVAVSLNLAIARVRQCVAIIKAHPADRDEGLGQIRILQKDWDSAKEQVAIVVDDKIVLHPGPHEVGQHADEQWKDAANANESLYHMMKRKRRGFWITQITGWQDRLTAIAFEEIDPGCRVIAEAHYHQENWP